MHANLNYSTNVYRERYFVYIQADCAIEPRATMRRYHWLQQNLLMNNIYQRQICCRNPARLVKLFYFSFIAVVRTALT